MKKVAILSVLLASFIAMGFLTFSVKGQFPVSFWVVATEGGTTDPVPADNLIFYHCDFTVTAIPDHCYMFDHWEFSGVDMGAINPITVFSGDGLYLLAVFKPIIPCGGDSVSIVPNKSGLLNPYLCLISTVLVAATLTSAYFKRVFRKTEKT